MRKRAEKEWPVNGNGKAMEKRAVKEWLMNGNRKIMAKRLGICLLAVLTGRCALEAAAVKKEILEGTAKVTAAPTAAESAETPKLTESTEAPELTPTAMPTPELTVTLTPTAVPEPTAIPEPTPTVSPEPTAAPTPTETPVSKQPESPAQDFIGEFSEGTLSAPQEEGTLSKPDHPDTVTNDKLIFIGDSRTEGIRDAVDNPGNVIWSCLSSMGYDWMSSTGVPQIEDEIDEYTAVIILMGVNDVYQINNYVNYINKKANEWADLGARTYFVSVGPVESDPYVTNREIEVFNSEMEANLAGVTYIDVYSHLVSNGFYTVDGIHYPDSVSREIYDFVLDNLEETRSGIWG